MKRLLMLACLSVTAATVGCVGDEANELTPTPPVAMRDGSIGLQTRDEVGQSAPGDAWGIREFEKSQLTVTSFNLTPSQVAYIDSQNPNTNYSGVPLRVYNGTGGGSIGLIQFDFTGLLAQGVNPNNISSATLTLKESQSPAPVTGPNSYFFLFEIDPNNAWTGSQVTYNNRQTGVPWNSLYAMAPTALVSYATKVSIDVKAGVVAWMGGAQVTNGTNVNNGFGMEASQGDDVTWTNTSGTSPSLSITCAPTCTNNCGKADGCGGTCVCNLLPAAIADAGDPNGNTSGFYVGDGNEGNINSQLGTIVANPNAAWHGSFGIQWDGNPNIVNDCGGVKFQTRSLDANATYTLSYYAKAATTNSQGQQTQIQFGASVFWMGTTSESYSQPHVTESPSSWNRYSLTFTTKHSGIFEAWIAPYYCGAPDRIYLDGIMLQYGATATAWLPGS